MSAAGWTQFSVVIGLVLATTPLLGHYLAGVYGDEKTPRTDKIFGGVERIVYKIARVDPSREQRWTVYAFSLLAFSLVSFLGLYLLQRMQNVLPANPVELAAVPGNVAFNVAVSFTTNTNWQAYAGEATMSHFTQMAGLTVQNFVSAAAGMAVMAALIRGLARRGSGTIGNFWVDLTRGITRVLLPLSVIVALVLISQGVIQNLSGFTEAQTLAGGTQSVPGGPAASQVAIKQLGTNGGGFFDMNSAHPFENPTTLSNLVQTWCILIIPFSLAFTFGRMVGDRRQGRAVFSIMFVIWGAMSVGSMLLEAAGTSQMTALGVDQSSGDGQSGGYLEGKETRFGTAASALWAAATTGTSNGSVNSMHDSYTAGGGGLNLAHMMLGEISPGGVGVGLNGLLVMVMLAVFIAGLMVGRTPEYLGKKLGVREMKLLTLYLLAMPTVLLSFSAAAVVLPSALESLNNPGPHGLSEILYAYASAANNNGSAFAGLNSATDWFTVTQGITMMVGRFALIIPVLAIAGSMAAKTPAPQNAGTLPTHTPLFGGLVLGIVVVVGGLTFLPVLALGPVLELLSV